ncbi:MAG: hypothetical protein Q9190_001057 [Brigantiaea leucoxantha]
MPPTDRATILARLRDTIQSGKPILGAGAGIGLSAKFIEKGGADLILVYNSGRFRMAGRGSLAGMMPYGDANAIVVEMVGALPLILLSIPGIRPGKMYNIEAREVLPVVQNTPVLAGVCATDPYRNIPNFLQDLKALGFCGVQNFPTVGLIDGNFRRDLEATGMSYEMEVAMIRTARQMDLVTTPYVFNIDEGVRMTKAGADVVVVHLGLTTGGSIGAEGRQGRSLDDCIRVVQEVRDACVEVNPDVIVLCHGGPISGVEDTRYVLERVHGVHGFFGASSMERLPVETAIQENALAFKNIRISGQR